MWSHRGKRATSLRSSTEHVCLQGCVADQGRAESCKASGNACFKGLAFSDAVEHYTGAPRSRRRRCLPSPAAPAAVLTPGTAHGLAEALQYTDETSLGGAALAAVLYTNRALSLRRLTQPAADAALSDTTAALECDPAHQKAIYQRNCILQERGDSPPAVPPAGAGRPAQAPEDTAVEMTSRLEGELRLGEDASTEEATAGRSQPAPDAALAAATVLARQASPALTVERQECGGRLLVAAEPLAAGDEVLHERPYAHVLSPANRRTHCAHCCSALAAEPAAAYSCRRCPLAAYCSLSCREADAFHVPGGPECGLPWPVLLPFHLVLALRLARRQLQEVSGQ